MDADILRIVRRVSVISAGLGFAFSPLPTAGGFALLPLHAGMFVAIARARARPLRELPWIRVAGVTAAATAMRSVADVALRFGPRTGRISNVVTAVALTRFLGWYVDRTCVTPEAPPGVSLRGLWHTFTSRGPVASTTD